MKASIEGAPNFRKGKFLSILAGLLFCSMTTGSVLAEDCESLGAVEKFCGFRAPEDIEVMPDGKHLLFSPFGGPNGEWPQAFHLFDPQTGEAVPIDYRAELTPPRWDDGLCPSPAQQLLGSHGIHIGRRSDGLWQLLAVNHRRETVEMYQIIGDQLAWRGCVSFPAKTNLNDVVAIPSGGFLVTHMMDKEPGRTLEQALAIEEASGFVWRWRPGKGLDKLPGSDAALANGITISADGNTVFLAASKSSQVIKIDYHRGVVLGVVTAQSADNLSWTPDGKLLVTGINGEMPKGCMTDFSLPCSAPFQVLRFDPETLAAEVLWQQSGPPMGGGTVAVEHEGFLYMGSGWGRQAIRVPMPTNAAP